MFTIVHKQKRHQENKTKKGKNCKIKSYNKGIWVTWRKYLMYFRLENLFYGSSKQCKENEYANDKSLLKVQNKDDCILQGSSSLILLFTVTIFLIKNYRDQDDRDFVQPIYKRFTTKHPRGIIIRQTYCICKLILD